MSSLKKKAIASLVIICILLSQSVSVLASVEEIVTNNEETMNVTEENLSGTEEQAITPGENVSGNENTPETPGTPAENNENNVNTEENTVPTEQTVVPQEQGESNQNQVAEVPENENNVANENNATRSPMMNVSLRATAPAGALRATSATGTAQISVSKELTGATLQANQFSFVLKDETGAEVETVKNDANGNVNFSTITFNQNQVGTHTYTITEVNEGLQGYTYDSKTITATVEVTDNNDGTLSTNVSYSPNAVFNNSYALNARTTATIEMTKALTGGRLQNGQFTFELKDNTGAVVARTTNDAQGRVRFTVGYNSTGTYNYTVTEVNDGQTGYTYDSSTKNVTVRVIMNFWGRLSANVMYLGNRTFNNTYTYTATGTAQISVSKELTGADLQADQFSFVLNDETGTEVETVKNDANGNVNFSEITYNQDQVGTHTYTITEVNDGAEGYTYDSKTITATVEVTDNGDGTLSTNVTYSPDSVFNNSYAPRLTATVEVTKVVRGATLEDGQFHFELKDNNGRTVARATNDAQGRVRFTVGFNNAGTYNYTVTEVNDGQTGYTYDSSTKNVTVRVMNFWGRLSANVAYSGSRTFTNTYAATGTAQINVSKELEGRALEDGQFSFTLRNRFGMPIQTVRNDARGNVIFDEITYNLSQVGTHTYTITERNDGAAGYTYDSKTITATVEVTDNGDGTLSTDITYSPDGVFRNTYTAEGTAAISVSKELTGETLQANQFSFVLSDATGTEVETVKNDANGNVNFSEITFNQDQVGTNTYTITEVNEGLQGYTYDSKTITATVEVTDNGDGTLSTDVSYSPNSVFNNSYELNTATRATIELTKRLNGANLQAGQFTFELKDMTGRTVARTTNDAQGRIRFTVGFDSAGMYNYRVTEVNTGAAGYTYDSSTINVMVFVMGFGGRLSANVMYLGNRTFTNSYTAEGTAEINVSKQLTGRTLEDGQFTFVLRNRYGMQIQTATNDADGNVSFSRTYNQNQVGTHTYTITERNDGIGGYTYDSKQITVTVEVTDNGDGTLSTDVSYSTDTVFRNTYTAEGTAVIEATKVLDGRELEDGQFTFVLRNRYGMQIQTARNDADGKVSFSRTYNQNELGTHRYMITENIGRARGYSYDRRVVMVTVEVTDNGDGTLNTNITYSPENVFTNTYRARGTAQISVSKELKGLELQPDQFSFVLKGEDGAEIETVTNDADGNVNFSTIAYNQYEVGTHKYTITEESAGAIGFIYDSKVIEVTVEVIDNGNGTLSTNVSYSDEVFTNIYERVDVNVRAFWNDKDNEFRYRPESIVVRLYANGVEIDHAIVKESDGWKCTFPGLDKYMDGKKVNYTISEDKFFGYDVTIKKNAENEYAIIHDLAPIGGGNPNDFVITQPVSNLQLKNPRTGAHDHVAICIALSIASMCAMVVATKRYNNNKNK